MVIAARVGLSLCWALSGRQAGIVDLPLTRPMTSVAGPREQGEFLVELNAQEALDGSNGQRAAVLLDRFVGAEITRLISWGGIHGIPRLCWELRSPRIWEATVTLEDQVVQLRCLSPRAAPET